MKIAEIPMTEVTPEHICLSRNIINHLGGIDEAAIFAALRFYDEQYSRDTADYEGWFPITYAKLQEIIPISTKRMRRRFKAFFELGVLTFKHIGIPAKRYYKINYAKIEDLFGSTEGQEEINEIQ